MSLVSGYTPSYGSTAVDITAAAASNTSFYGHPHHHQTVSGGDYSNGQQQSFFASSGWSWPTGSEYQAPAHVQQHSPPLSCYSSSTSPDYYAYQQPQQHQHHYESAATPSVISSAEFHPQTHPSAGSGPPRVVRVVKRRNTANKKERRRTMSINNAFSELRDCIPNVPADTKLSKIKTLRLATSYISYLMTVLEAGPETDIPFRAELGRQSKSEKLAAQQQQQMQQSNAGMISKEHQQAKDECSVNSMLMCPSAGDKRSKGRTGWPHHVWALELKQ